MTIPDLVFVSCDRAWTDRLEHKCSRNTERSATDQAKSHQISGFIFCWRDYCFVHIAFLNLQDVGYSK